MFVGGTVPARGHVWLGVALVVCAACLLSSCGGESTATSSTSTREDTRQSGGDPAGTGEFCADLDEWLTTTYEGVFDEEQVATVESLTEKAPDELVGPLETIGAEMARIAELDDTDPDAALEAFSSIGPESDYMAAVGDVWAWAGSNPCPGS